MVWGTISLTEYKVFNIRCQSCRREGQLSIEWNDSIDWDYVMTGFSGTVDKKGPDLSTLECFRCGARKAIVESENDGFVGGFLN